MKNSYSQIQKKRDEIKMKKCPRCLKYDDDSVRFCKKCNTELFFEDRFPAEGKNIMKKSITKSCKKPLCWVQSARAYVRRKINKVQNQIPDE